MAITISNSDLIEIKEGLVSAFIGDLDWGTDTDNYVKTHVVTKVLRQYFRYFPLKYDQVLPLNGYAEIPYPDLSVSKPDWFIFALLRHFINWKNEYAGDLTSPFFLQSQVIGLGRYNVGVTQNDISEMFSRVVTAESYIDGVVAQRVEDYQEERKIKCYININSMLSLQWAVKSDNFSDIRWNHKDDALKLGRAYLIQNAFILREQLKIQNTKVDINTYPIYQIAQGWEEEVIEKWSGSGKAVLVK